MALAVEDERTPGHAVGDSELQGATGARVGFRMREFLDSWFGYGVPKKRQTIAIGAVTLTLVALIVLAGMIDEIGGIVGQLLSLVLLLTVGFVGFMLYFLPAFIARKKPNANAVLIINVFLGWTFIGWVVALAMAVSNPTPPVIQTGVAQSSSRPEPTGRRCPFCAEDIKPAAIVCKHCGRDLPSADG